MFESGPASRHTTNHECRRPRLGGWLCAALHCPHSPSIYRKHDHLYQPPPDLVFYNHETPCGSLPAASDSFSLSVSLKRHTHTHTYLSGVVVRHQHLARRMKPVVHHLPECQVGNLRITWVSHGYHMVRVRGGSFGTTHENDGDSDGDGSHETSHSRHVFFLLFSPREQQHERRPGRRKTMRRKTMDQPAARKEKIQLNTTNIHALPLPSTLFLSLAIPGRLATSTPAPPSYPPGN